METMTEMVTMTTVISRWRHKGGGCLKAKTAFSTTCETQQIQEMY